MVKTQGIVLRSVWVADSRLLVTLFTKDLGVVSCGVRVSKSARRGGARALWQVLSVVDLEVDWRVGRDVQSVREARLAFAWGSMTFHPVKMVVVLFLGEFLSHALKGEGMNEPLYDFLLNSLRWYDEATEGYASFHLVLLMRLTRFLGFWPNVMGVAKSVVSEGDVFFDMMNGCFVSSVPAHGQYLGGEESRLLPVLLGMDYMQMHRVRLSRTERRRMLDVIVCYYRLHVPAFGVIRGLDVLGEIFD